MRRSFPLLLVLLSLIIVACQPTAGDETATRPPSTLPAATALPTATITHEFTLRPPSTAVQPYPEPATATPVSPYPGTDGPTATFAPVCTPPACAADEVYFCEGECPGGCGTTCATVTPQPEAGAPDSSFSGEIAFDYLEEQMAFGPRYPGSPGHTAVADYIVQELSSLGWQVEEQPLQYMGVEGRNLIARANEDEEPIIILGAHYDSRRVADQSPGAQALEPVPGAVDGASGVAVLLELARSLELETVPAEIWLAFFDMEDQGSDGMAGWDWIVGSSYMAANLQVEPAAMILVDMVGDADQQLYYEGNSDPALREELWAIAADLGYDGAFIPEVKYTMIDDHLPFAEQGIPAVDIIDFDYPYWHTVEDTADKASAESLLRVGHTLEVWLEDHVD